MQTHTLLFFRRISTFHCLWADVGGEEGGAYYRLTPAMARPGQRSGCFWQAPAGAQILPGTPWPALEMSPAGVRLQCGVE